MQFTLKLSTDELKTLQLILEHHKATYPKAATDHVVSDLMTKLIVLQVESEELSPRERAFLEREPEDVPPEYGGPVSMRP